MNLYMNFIFGTFSCNQKLIWLGSREFFILNMDTSKFGGHKLCRRGDIPFLIYRVASCDYVRKGLYTLTGEISLTFVTTLPGFDNFSKVVKKLGTLAWGLFTVDTFSYLQWPKVSINDVFKNKKVISQFTSKPRRA